MRSENAMIKFEITVPEEGASNALSPGLMVMASSRKKNIAFVANCRVRIGEKGTSVVFVKAEDFRKFRHKEPLDMRDLDNLAIGYGGWRKGKPNDRIAFEIKAPEFVD